MFHTQNKSEGLLEMWGLSISPMGPTNVFENLETSLEAHFMQIDGTREKILSIPEHINGTQDRMSIQPGNQRN
jgi:hypothetical protein